MALARAVFMRSPWEKPAARRSAMTSMPSWESTCSIRREVRGRYAAQFAEVGEIFAGGEPGVETYVIEQGSNGFVDSNPAVVRLEDSTDHAEGGGFAGAVRSQETGNGSVGGVEG
jgi:hypothetical protein